MTVVVVKVAAEISASVLPLVGLVPSLSVRVAQRLVALGELIDGHLQQASFITELLLFLLQLQNVAVSALENGPFVLFVASDKLGDILNAFVDDFTAAALNCSRLANKQWSALA